MVITVSSSDFLGEFPLRECLLSKKSEDLWSWEGGENIVLTIKLVSALAKHGQDVMRDNYLYHDF